MPKVGVFLPPVDEAHLIVGNQTLRVDFHNSYIGRLVVTEPVLQDVLAGVVAEHADQRWHWYALREVLRNRGVDVDALEEANLR